MSSGSDSGGKEDDEDRWLQARERGEQGPVIAEATAATYAELHALMQDLPAVPVGAQLSPGWQDAVLDAIGRGAVPAPVEPVASIADAQAKRSRRKRVAIVFSGLALAAGVAVVLTVPRAPTSDLTVAGLSTDGTTRGSGQLRAGDKAVVHGVIEGRGELRVYDAEDVELARCTVTGAGCTVDRSGERTDLRLELPLNVIGPLRVVLLSAPLSGASGGRARDLEAARRAGIMVVKDLNAVVR
jgi:hypothetical protein